MSDFGSSKIVDIEAKLDATNTIQGTKIYFSPEKVEERLIKKK